MLEPDFGIIGYTDRWTYRPGETVRIHASAVSNTRATACLHRVCARPPRDEILGIGFERIAETELEIAVAPQTTATGSYLAIPDGGRLPLEAGLTIALHVRPTLIGSEPHGLIDKGRNGDGFALLLTPGRGLDLVVSTAEVAGPVLRLDRAVSVGQWARIALAYDAGSGEVVLSAGPLEGAIRSASAKLPAHLRFSDSPLRFGAAPTRLVPGARSLDGRIESPVLARSALAPELAFEALRQAGDGAFPDHPAVIAAWDFSRNPDLDLAVDLGPRALHGRFVNLPTRAVTGLHWNGRQQNWRSAPRHYAAVHFHEDDLLDAGWAVAAEMSVPDLTSGVYVIALESPLGRDTLPIFVGPSRVPSSDRLALVLPTFTYLAYANDRCLLHGANPEVLADRLIVLTRGDCCLAAHPEFGLSLYDTHADGSGVVFASRRRPCLTLRHSQRAWQGGLGAGLWNFPADLLIVSWLERSGFAYDILTDDMLDQDGTALTPYRCVLTGSHPEYHTERTLDAFRDYVEGGGRLLALGGNGFYWRVATHPDFPEVIELRRAEDGNRSWAAEPGEYYHAFDGAYGGLWRRNGRPPQMLTGVGYVGQGFVRSRPYRRLPASRDARTAFLFEGIEDEILGDFGCLGGGAAGIEIDHADARLGTPEHALVLATADDFDDTCILANEEVLVNRPTLFGDLAPQLRADLVFFETRAGGAVLSTGSIAWAGSLADPREPNPISRLTSNAIRRFLDPAPFAWPEDDE